ncbi:MAG: alginate lyase family protein [Phycisphaerae bacterium]
MTAREIWWRVCGRARDWRDRWLIGYHGSARRLPALLRRVHTNETRIALSDMPTGAWRDAAPDTAEACWRDRLVARAEEILAGRWRLFDLDPCEFGDRVDWNRDAKARRRAPLAFAPKIDYRDFRVVGDCKFVWEPNRHHQLVVLARAFRASGEERFAAGAAKQLASWLDACPYGRGMNWRSPLELGIRLINWVWTLDLAGSSAAFDARLRRRVLHAAHLHLREITRKYSRGSSANNHLVGEAAGAYVASCYFHELRDASQWREEARGLLVEQIEAQTLADGANVELATGYHLFAMQFFLVAGLVARRVNDALPDAYWSRLAAQAEYLGTLLEGGADAPMFGDADDGYVLDLAAGGADARGWLCAAAALFRRADLKAWSGREFSESACWLLGSGARSAWERLPKPADARLRSRGFKNAGIYLLQHGTRDAADRVSVTIDCGPHGWGSIAAHAHADALAITLRAFGVDVLVDPGTYDYFSTPAWRNYFRSTAAHNTIEIDGRDQSEMLGAFLWGSRAAAQCLRWEPSTVGGRVVCEHDGYTRLSDPVLHRREVRLDGGAGRVVMRDELVAKGAHALALHLHFAEQCVVRELDGNRYEVDAGPGRLVLELAPEWQCELLRGGDEPGPGWVSRGYHRKTPAVCIRARTTIHCASAFETRIAIQSGDERDSTRSREPAADAAGAPVALSGR